MVAEPRTASVADFMAMPDDGDRHEYVRGGIRSMPPPKGRHGVLAGYLHEEIAHYLHDRALALGWHAEDGFVAKDRLVGFTARGEFGFKFSLPDDPDQIRGSDCVYVPAEQLAEVAWDEDEYFPAVPWLLVEVISSSDLAADVDERVQDYLAGAAQQIWCVYPSRYRVHVHIAGGPTRVLRRTDTLAYEDLLPGFSLPVARLF
jgi:Uma2 family endonuclease